MQDFLRSLLCGSCFPLPLSFKVKKLLPQSPGLVSETQFPKLRFWGLVQAISAELSRQRRLSVLSGTYSHRLSAGLVVSTESDSASCQVTLRHPFPSRSVPFPHVLLSAALRTLVLGLGSHLSLAAAPSWLRAHDLSHWFCSRFFCQRRALKSAGTAKNPVCTTTPQTSLYFYCSVNYCLNFNKSLRQEGGPAVRFLCKHWARQ